MDNMFATLMRTWARTILTEVVSEGLRRAEHSAVDRATRRVFFFSYLSRC